MITVSLEGFDQMLEIVDPVRFTQIMDPTVYRAASTLRDLAKKMPPVSASRTGYGAHGIPVAPLRGGTLRSSIQAQKLGLFAAGVYTNPGIASYGGYVHDGTGRMPARPWFQWLLDDFQGKDIIEVIIRAGLDRVANP